MQKYLSPDTQRMACNKCSQLRLGPACVFAGLVRALAACTHHYGTRGGGCGEGRLWLAREDLRTGPGLRCPQIPQAPSAWRGSWIQLIESIMQFYLLKQKPTDL